MIRFLAACLLLTASPALAQEEVETPPAPAPVETAAPYDFAGPLRDYFRPLEARRDFSGVISARRNGELVAYERFGAANFETGAPITPETRFPVGSITKSLTAALILELEADGYLRLDDRLGRHAPDLVGGQDLTIGEVLDHRAGLPRDYPVTGGPQSSDGLIDWLNAEDAIRPGPHEPSYSNVGYDLLAVIAERAAYARYEMLASARFFTRLGMLDSAILRDRSLGGANLAVGYAAGPPPTGLRAPMALPGSLSAGGLTATPDDLLAWGQAVLDRRIDLFREDGTMRGGFTVRTLDGRTIYTLQGTEPGYAAGLSLIPEESLVIVYAANIESYPAIQAREIIHALALGQPVEPAPQRSDESELLDSHGQAIGRYQTPDFGEVEIVASEDGLDLVLTGPQWRFYLTPSGEERLVWRTFNAELLFQRDPITRLVTGLEVTQTPLVGEPIRYEAPRLDLPAPILSDPAE
jgi:CubicO group peptidase (beta-lactamase class C family)